MFVVAAEGVKSSLQSGDLIGLGRNVLVIPFDLFVQSPNHPFSVLDLFLGEGECVKTFLLFAFGVAQLLVNVCDFILYLLLLGILFGDILPLGDLESQQ